MDKTQSTTLTGLLIAVTVMVVACVVVCANTLPPFGDPVVIPVSTIGAYLENGHPAALFKPCQGTTEDEVTLFDEGPRSASPTGTPSSSETASPTGTVSSADTLGPAWRVTANGNPGIDHVVLLDTPPGWLVTDGALTDFVDGRTYTIFLGKDKHASVLEFTLADLRALGDREVWAWTEGLERRTAMTRDEFGRIAGCHTRS